MSFEKAHTIGSAFCAGGFVTSVLLHYLAPLHPGWWPLVGAGFVAALVAIWENRP